jgi:hypothetical protein
MLYYIIQKPMLEHCIITLLTDCIRSWIHSSTAMMYNLLQDFLYTLENKDSSKPSD